MRYQPPREALKSDLAAAPNDGFSSFSVAIRRCRNAPGAEVGLPPDFLPAALLRSIESTYAVKCIAFQRGPAELGEAKRKLRRLADMVAADPWCIYCNDRASTVEHMPPRAMFEPFRPKGMEFPCCQLCNSSTKAADQVASWISYLQLDAGERALRPAFRKLLGGIQNNFPEIIREWKVPRAKEKFDLKRSGLTPNHGAIRVDGPLTSHYMETFAAKFGFAVHFERSGQRVGPRGGVAVRWFSNKNLIEGEVPFDMLNELEGPATLRQGKQHVGDRFAYKWKTDGTMTGVFGGFGEAFAVVVSRDVV